MKADDSGKQFQSQVEKLKIIKGVGEANPEPCNKGMGYLSIEKINDTHHVVYRALTGQVFFQGVLNKAAAKTKVLTEADDPKHAHKFKVKFTVAVKSKECKESEKAETPQPKFAVEHCQARFQNP